jgi:hypothetical protein
MEYKHFNIEVLTSGTLLWHGRTSVKSPTLSEIIRTVAIDSFMLMQAERERENTVGENDATKKRN